MTSGILVRISAVVILLFLALPLLIVISVSFTASGYLSFPPQGLSLEWYRQFWRDTSYFHSMLLSAGLAVIAACVSAIVGVPAALGLRKFRFKGASAVQALFLSPLALPGIVIGAAMLQFAGALGIDRTIWALVIAHSVICIPYMVRTTLAALDDDTLQLEAAARDLGANGLEVFALVTLPLIKTGVVAGFFFAFIISWINVEVSMFNTTSSLMPIPVKMFNYVQYNIDPLIAAVSALTIYVAFIAVVLVDAVVGLERVTVSRR